MTAYSAACLLCRTLVDWIDCPTGGWWVHRVHPVDGHDAEISWQPVERINDQGEWETV